jgi:FKBP-type peptidyl-prolyl cis-trans isomerase FklB
MSVEEHIAASAGSTGLCKPERAVSARRRDTRHLPVLPGGLKTPRVLGRLPGTVNRVKLHATDRKQTIAHALTRNVPVHQFLLQCFTYCAPICGACRAEEPCAMYKPLATTRFAKYGKECDNRKMYITRKSISIAVALAAAVVVFGGSALAQESSTQQTSTSTSKSSTASKKPAAETHAATKASHPAAKAAQATAPKSDATAGSLATDKQKESYALGMNIARRLKDQPVDLDKAALVQGFKDELTGGKMQLTDAEATVELKKLSDEAQQKQQEQEKATAEANMKEGEAFLAANKTNEGVVVLPSGLQYKIETQGTGPKPTASDTVVCNYRGTFINGTEFDSSYKRGQPTTFQVGGVIKGWTEALQLMPVGSKWQLFIPPDLAYGPRGAGGVIGPNATLVFEVELLSIKGK